MGTKLTPKEIEKIQQKQEAFKLMKEKDCKKENNQTVKK